MTCRTAVGVHSTSLTRKMSFTIFSATLRVRKPRVLNLYNPVGFNGLTRILLDKPGEYKGLKGKGRIPKHYLNPKNRLCRNQHLMAFQIHSAGTNAFSLRLSGCRMILCLCSFL